MSEVSDVRKAFEDSLRRIDELIEAMRAEPYREDGWKTTSLESTRLNPSHLLISLCKAVRCEGTMYICKLEPPKKEVVPRWLNLFQSRVFITLAKEGEGMESFIFHAALL